jgi:hypothetical protein
MYRDHELATVAATVRVDDILNDKRRRDEQPTVRLRRLR